MDGLPTEFLHLLIVCVDLLLLAPSPSCSKVPIQSDFLSKEMATSRSGEVVRTSASDACDKHYRAQAEN